LAACRHFLDAHADARLLLVGLPEALQGFAHERATLVPASEVVAMDDPVEIALRRKKDSSMRVAIVQVKEGAADAAVSAGNTGALMAIARYVLKTMDGIDRPAIASFFPTMRSESVMLDLGANVQCDANNLVQFAVMGNVFARAVLGVQQPSMGILNVGAEELKGHDAVKVAASMLRDVPLPGKFVGFVEGDDIAKGTVDVVVTDGFTGNIALKTIEGTVKLYGHWLKQTFSMSIWSKLAYLFARPALNGLRAQVDPRRYNGAILMGLNGICVKSHGGTDSFGFANAIGVAVNMVQNDAMERMRQDLAQLMAVPGGEAMAAAL